MAVPWNHLPKDSWEALNNAKVSEEWWEKVFGKKKPVWERTEEEVHDSQKIVHVDEVYKEATPDE